MMTILQVVCLILGLMFASLAGILVLYMIRLFLAIDEITKD